MLGGRVKYVSHSGRDWRWLYVDQGEKHGEDATGGGRDWRMTQTRTIAADGEWNGGGSGALRRTAACGKLHRCIALGAEVLLMGASFSQAPVVSLFAAG